MLDHNIIGLELNMYSEDMKDFRPDLVKSVGDDTSHFTLKVTIVGSEGVSLDDQRQEQQELRARMRMILLSGRFEVILCQYTVTTGNWSPWAAVY